MITQIIMWYVLFSCMLLINFSEKVSDWVLLFLSLKLKTYLI